MMKQSDETQQNHLKAYGITYWVLQQDVEVDWLLNYRGGSWIIPDSQEIEGLCNIRGVSFENISGWKNNFHGKNHRLKNRSE